MQQDFANPSSSHRLGKKLADELLSIEGLIKQTLKLPQTYHVIFTSCATESNNLLLQSKINQGDAVYFDHSDHASLTVPIKYKTSNNKPIPLAAGQIDYLSWDNSWVNETKLVALSLLHGLTGRELDLQQLQKWLHFKKSKAHLHLDLSQAIGRMPCKLDGVDSMTLSAHKMGGPKGVACLILKDLSVRPLLMGGGQQIGIRPGTIAYPLIAAWSEVFSEMLHPRLGRREMIIQWAIELEQGMQQLGFKRMVSEAGPWIHLYHVADYGPYPSDMIMRLLEQKEIYVSSSTACNAKKKGSVEEFAGLGIDNKEHGRMLRISFGYESNQQDVRALLEGLSEAREKLKATLG
jgi:cysteine desulfurase